MSLYKRGNVFWSAIWVDGERQMRSLETSNRRRAEALERVFRDELHAKKFQHREFKPEMIFGELYTRFLAEGEVKAYHIERSKLFLPFFTDMQIGRITRNDIARYRKQRHEQYLLKQKEATQKQLSETTINRDIEVVRHLLFWAADEGFLPANPIARIRMVPERRQRRPVMPVAEEVKLLPSCSDHLRHIVIAALDTGMRRGELLKQLWEHVDFDRKLISITRSKTAAGDHRLIPMTDRVYEMLSAARQPSGPLFTYEGGPLKNLKTGWAGALRRAGIPHYRFHDLRHTFNSRLVEVGVIADVRKELMGHSHGGDVHSLYTHVELPTLRDAIARLEAWHLGKLSSLTTSNTQGENPNARPIFPATPQSRRRHASALLRPLGGDQPRSHPVACRPRLRRSTGKTIAPASIRRVRREPNTGDAQYLARPPGTPRRLNLNPTTVRSQYDNAEGSTRKDRGYYSRSTRYYNQKAMGQAKPGRGRPRANRQAGRQSRRDARGSYPRGTRTLEAPTGQKGLGGGVTSNHNPRSTLFIDAPLFYIGGDHEARQPTEDPTERHRPERLCLLSGSAGDTAR